MPATSLYSKLVYIEQTLTGIQTTVSVTNGVGVHVRGGLELELDSEGTELEKLRNKRGCKGLRRTTWPSRNKERVFMMAAQLKKTKKRVEVVRSGMNEDKVLAERRNAAAEESRPILDRGTFPFSRQPASWSASTSAFPTPHGVYKSFGIYSHLRSIRIRIPPLPADIFPLPNILPENLKNSTTSKMNPTSAPPSSSPNHP